MITVQQLFGNFRFTTAKMYSNRVCPRSEYFGNPSVWLVLFPVCRWDQKGSAVKLMNFLSCVRNFNLKKTRWNGRRWQTNCLYGVCRKFHALQESKSPFFKTRSLVSRCYTICFFVFLSLNIPTSHFRSFTGFLCSFLKDFAAVSAGRFFSDTYGWN